MRFVFVFVLCSAPAFASPSPDQAQADPLLAAEAEMQKGDQLFDAGHYDSAAVYYKAALALAPNKPGPYYWLGMSYVNGGRCQDAIPVFEQYLKLKVDEPNPEAVARLNECKAKLQAPTPVAPLVAPPPNVPPPATPLAVAAAPIGKQRPLWVIGLVVPIVVVGVVLGVGLGIGLSKSSTPLEFIR